MSAEPYNEPTPFCESVIYSVLQDPAQLKGRTGFTVALVAPHQGAGSTYLTYLLADSLNLDNSDSALVVSCTQLAILERQSKLGRDVAETSHPANDGSPHIPQFSVNWHGSHDFRSTYLYQLRERHQYILIDCQSLKESNDVLSLARIVDGFFIVVEANRTQKTQLAYMERTLERAGGKIFGHLLNKRTYPIPEWLHARLERWGQ